MHRMQGKHREEALRRVFEMSKSWSSKTQTHNGIVSLRLEVKVGDHIGETHIGLDKRWEVPLASSPI